MSYKDKNITDILDKYKSAKFKWGKMDCCIFAGLVLEEYHDIKFLSGLYARYKNRVGASKIILKLGGRSIADLPTIVCKVPRKGIKDVKYADMVLLHENNNKILGVCNGAQSYFISDKGGLTTRPTHLCKYAWSIK